MELGQKCVQISARSYVWARRTVHLKLDTSEELGLWDLSPKTLQNHDNPSLMFYKGEMSENSKISIEDISMTTHAILEIFSALENVDFSLSDSNDSGSIQ